MNKLLEAFLEYNRLENELANELINAGFGNYVSNVYDFYDNSIEFYDVGDDEKLNDTHQQIIYNQGFSRAWLNHLNGKQTYYDLQDKFKK